MPLTHGRAKSHFIDKQHLKIVLRRRFSDPQMERFVEVSRPRIKAQSKAQGKARIKPLGLTRFLLPWPLQSAYFPQQYLFSPSLAFDYLIFLHKNNGFLLPWPLQTAYFPPD